MDSSSSSRSRQNGKKIGWIEWLNAWFHLISEILFQKIYARNLGKPLPLPKLTGLTCIVTGSTSGIGLEIARQLAEAEAHVVMAVRNTKAAQEIIQKWQKNKTIKLKVDVMELDLLSLESVVKFSDTWNSYSKPLHVLINNAGIFSMGQPQKISKNGYETHLQVNHLAPALLSILLLPSLKKSGTSRIINTNSVMHRFASIDTNDMNFSKRKFTSFEAYSSSKLSQLMFSCVLQKQIINEGNIDVLCVDPGTVRTNVARDFPRFVQVGYHLLINLFDAQEGSRSAIFAATDDDVIKYCRKLKAEENPVCAYVSYYCCPINPSEQAQKEGNNKLVWEKTLEMIGLPLEAVEKVLEGKEVNCRYRV